MAPSRATEEALGLKGKGKKQVESGSEEVRSDKEGLWKATLGAERERSNRRWEMAVKELRKEELSLTWFGLTCEVLVWATVALRFVAEACNK